MKKQTPYSIIIGTGEDNNFYRFIIMNNPDVASPTCSSLRERIAGIEDSQIPIPIIPDLLPSVEMVDGVLHVECTTLTRAEIESIVYEKFGLTLDLDCTDGSLHSKHDVIVQEREGGVINLYVRPYDRSVCDDGNNRQVLAYENYTFQQIEDGNAGETRYVLSEWMIGSETGSLFGYRQGEMTQEQIEEFSLWDLYDVTVFTVRYDSERRRVHQSYLDNRARSPNTCRGYVRHISQKFLIGGRWMHTDCNFRLSNMKISSDESTD